MTLFDKLYLYNLLYDKCNYYKWGYIYNTTYIIYIFSSYIIYKL